MGGQLAGGRLAIGRPASGGLAAGPVHWLDVARTERAGTGSPASETEALRDALARASRDLVDLAAGADGEAAEMLAFQIAMLEDEALSEGAFDAISAGVAADHAWREAMRQEIAGYESADDEYFRARAADLADIRDRVLRRLTGDGEDRPPPPGAILAGEDMTPSAFLAADFRHGGGILVTAGSPSSHVAMLARSRGVPMVVGAALGETRPSFALVDGDAGVATLDPSPAERLAFDARLATARALAAETERFRFAPAIAADGTRVRVLLNVADPVDLDGLDPAMCDGIGLTRTEFLFHGSVGLPDEDAQVEVYARILRWAAGRPVTIRTLDAGGDKPIEGLTIAETNPFLGLRGIRLSLARPDVFRVQLRALARAAIHGDLKVMLPMVSTPDELAAAESILEDEVAALTRSGIACLRPPVGIMVEVPATALLAGRFPAAFYSIGSNDLTQYTLAASRDSAAVAGLSRGDDPAVLELIRLTVSAGAARGVEVSLCGDAGADVSLLPRLLDTGLRSVSVAPLTVARVKAAIALWRKGDG